MDPALPVISPAGPPRPSHDGQAAPAGSDTRRAGDARPVPEGVFLREAAVRMNTERVGISASLWLS